MLLPDLLWAVDGPYLQSAHGASALSAHPGVKRPAMSGYATGNCAHCHEMHASLVGVEPFPGGGGQTPYTLFASNFDTGQLLGPYLESDNFCFYCHSDSASVQAVTNADYSTTFGGGSLGTLPQYIMEAFNQTSYHNLADIHDFVDGEDATSPWYSQYSNPCNGCHNPHIAKKNNDDPSLLLSAISKPSDHFSLWGETETMALVTSGDYEAPYSDASSPTPSLRPREPTEATDLDTINGAYTPDYVAFCTDCHKTTNIISSRVLGTLRNINWTSSGEKHGGYTRDGTLDILDPYASNMGKTNFLLSCLDCHEPHGSGNIMLLRKRVNGGNLNAAITSTSAMGSLCRQCHKDDDAAQDGTLDVNKWKYVHHYSSDAPYPGPPTSCGDCHAGGGGGGGGDPGPVACINCHFHGADDSWAPDYRETGRKTF